MAVKPKAKELRTQMGSLKINEKIYPLYEGINTIGRNKDATVTVRDLSVSQQHAIITIVNENKQFVSDLNSFNGTIIEQNKLNPMLLYELPGETVIHFAKCNAVYKKVSGNSQYIGDAGYNRHNMFTQETQNESFYTAETQDLASNSTKAGTTLFEDTALFEDEYNFSEIPSPPMQQTIENNRDTVAKSSISINDMPTQLYCSDVISDVVIGDDPILASSENEYEIITTKADIHDLPTQLICHDDAINKPVGEIKSNTTLQGSSIHDMPTQIIDISSDSIENCATMINTNKDISNNKAISPINKNMDCKSPHDSGSKTNNISNTEETPDISLDVIDESHLDDSTLHVTVSSINRKESEALKERKENKILLESKDIDDSSSEEIHKQKKKCRVIDSDDSTTDIEDLHDTVTRNISNSSANNRNVFSNSKNDHSLQLKGLETQKKSKQEKMGYLLEVSDNSLTDIEDFEDSVKVNTSKLPTKNSPLGVKECSKSFKDNKTIENVTSTKNSDTGINIADKTTSVVLKANEMEENNSDSDADDFEFRIKTKCTKETEYENLNESEVIPCTPFTNDDSVGFQFTSENNTSLVAKDKSNENKNSSYVTSGRIFDVSQKLRELRQRCVVPQECSEESLHLHLSESSESIKHCEEQMVVADNKSDEDDDKTPDISDNDEPIIKTDNLLTKCAEESNLCEKPNESEDVFAMATQKLIDFNVMQTDKKDTIFAKPMSSKSFNAIKKNESQCSKYSQDTEDDLFLQATQPLILSNKNDKEKLLNSEDIFLQPTQKYDLDNQNTISKAVNADVIGDDIFMQATQQIVLPDASQPLALDTNKLDDDIFMQPTQVILSNVSANKTLQLLDNNQTKKISPKPLEVPKDHSDIFNQPTQLIEEISNSKTDDNNLKEDDIFMQPTQQIMHVTSAPLSHKNITEASVEKQSENDIFMEPTQVLSLEPTNKLVEVPKSKTDSTTNDNDIFMQETQLLLTNDPSDKPVEILDRDIQTPQKYLLSLHKDPAKRTKGDDVESQLEVMFASQTLRISPATNTRPSNPLVSVLDGKPITINSKNDDEDLQENVSDKSAAEDENSGPANSLDDFKEYCEMPTQPIDENISSHEIEDNSDKETKIHGQPSNEQASSSKDNTSARKRGRPAQNNLDKPSSGVNEVAANTRKLRSKMPSVDEVPVASKITKSEASTSKIAKIPTKNLLEPQPSASSSNSCKGDSKDVNENLKIGDDDIVKTVRSNSKKETEIKLDKNLRSNKITKTNNADDDTDEIPSERNTRNRRKSINSLSRDDGKNIPNNQNSETEEDDKTEIPTNRTRKPVKRNLIQSVNVSKRTRRNNNGNEDPEDNETKSSSIILASTPDIRRGKKSVNHASTSKVSKDAVINLVSDSDSESIATTKQTKVRNVQVKEKTAKKNQARETTDTPTSSNIHLTIPSVTRKKQPAPAQRMQSRRKAKNIDRLDADHDPTETPPNDTSDSDSDNIATTNRRKVGNIEDKETTTKKYQTTENTDTPTSSKSIPSMKIKNQPTPAKRVQLRTKILDADQDPSETPSRSRRNKRVLSKDSNKSNEKAPKKMKNKKKAENEEAESDNSENLPTSLKSASNVSMASSTPERNRRIQKPKVVFTMLNSPELESLVRRLGGMVVDTVSACTVLVTGSLKRSQKLLSAVGEGKPICSPTWLQECKKANKFVDPWDYILEDEEAENKWSFTLKESLNRSQSKRLLEEFTVVLAVTEAVDVLRAAIESCGGKCAMKTVPKNVENNVVVVANPTKKASYSKFLKQNTPPIVVAPEAIFDGVLRQEIHWDEHMLS